MVRITVRIFLAAGTGASLLKGTGLIVPSDFLGKVSQNFALVIVLLPVIVLALILFSWQRCVPLLGSKPL